MAARRLRSPVLIILSARVYEYDADVLGVEFWKTFLSPPRSIASAKGGVDGLISATAATTTTDGNTGSTSPASTSMHPTRTSDIVQTRSLVVASIATRDVGSGLRVTIQHHHYSPGIMFAMIGIPILALMVFVGAAWGF